MSANITGVTYTYPVPQCFSDGVAGTTIAALMHSIQDSFTNYETIRNNLLLQLNQIFFGDAVANYISLGPDGHITMADLIRGIQAVIAGDVLRAAIAKLTRATIELATAESNFTAASIKLDQARANISNLVADPTLENEMSARSSAAAETSSAAAARDEAEAEKETAEAVKNEAETAKNEAKLERDWAIRVKNSAEAAKNSAQVEKNEAEAERDSAIAARDEAATARNEAAVAKDEAEAALAAAQAGGDEEEIAAAEENLSNKEAALAAAEENLSNKEAELTAAENNLSSKEATLTAAETNLEDKEAALTAAQSSLDEKEAALTAAEENLDDKESALATAKATLTTAEEKLSRLDAVLAAEERLVQATTARDEARAKKEAVEAERAAAETAQSSFGKEAFVFSDCDESTAAYKFYGCQIIDKINKLTDYINEARAILNKWNSLSGYDLSSLVHSDVVRLECLNQFCSEIHSEFGAHYYYDFDEDNWKLAEDDYSVDDSHTQLEAYYGTYNALYAAKVRYNNKGNDEKVLDCFNELNLLDRLKYIRLYYAAQEVGQTNYVFPESKTVGFPCVAEDGIQNTDVRFGNLEKFYIGYLVDRDGPVNAFCSLYEIKVRALQETLNEMKKRIEALNVYLDFVNRALNVLNAYQNELPSDTVGIPDGATNVLGYICGQKAYNLFEDDDGTKYLVVPRPAGGGYWLIRADEEGEKFLVGVTGVGAINAGIGISTAPGCIDMGSPPLPTGWAYWGRPSSSKQIENFSLPKELEVAPIVPSSVNGYLHFGPDDAWDARNKKGADGVAMLESFQGAFNKKVEYLDNAIDVVKTDIEQIRNKINTYQSQASTFRNRVHDVYVNTIRKVKPQ